MFSGIVKEAATVVNLEFDIIGKYIGRLSALEKE
jgi:riboflavin synthase alpha subunit